MADKQITDFPSATEVLETDLMWIRQGPIDKKVTKSILEAAIGGLTPVGGIIMWSGAVVDIPVNWALCDGSNGTPNLTDKFIVGAGDTYAVDAVGGATSGTTSSDGAHTPSIAIGSTTLALSQSPAHQHTDREWRLTAFDPTGGDNQEYW